MVPGPDPWPVFPGPGPDPWPVFPGPGPDPWPVFPIPVFPIPVFPIPGFAGRIRRGIRRGGGLGLDQLLDQKSDHLGTDMLEISHGMISGIWHAGD